MRISYFGKARTGIAETKRLAIVFGITVGRARYSNPSLLADDRRAGAARSPQHDMIKGDAHGTSLRPHDRPGTHDAPHRRGSSTASSIERREPRPHACAAICGPTTVTSGIGCSAHCGGSTPAASAAMRAQWRSKPAGVQTST